MKLLQIVFIFSISLLTVIATEPEYLKQIIPKYIQMFTQANMGPPDASFEFPRLLKEIVNGTFNVKNIKIDGLETLKHILDVMQTTPTESSEKIIHIDIQLNTDNLLISGDYDLDISTDYKNSPLQLIYASGDFAFEFENPFVSINLDCFDKKPSLQIKHVSNTAIKFFPLIPTTWYVEGFQAYQVLNYVITEGLKWIYFSIQIEKRSECVYCIISRFVEFVLNDILQDKDNVLDFNCACLKTFTVKNVLEEIIESALSEALKLRYVDIPDSTIHFPDDSQNDDTSDEISNSDYHEDLNYSGFSAVPRDDPFCDADVKRKYYWQCTS